MKSKLIKHIGLLVSAALSFSAVSVLGLAIAESQTPAQQLKAASDYGTYYSSVSGTGSELLLSTYNTVKTHTDVGYTPGIWNLYNSCYKRSDGKMYDLYSDTTNFTPSSSQCGSYSDVGDCYNREHTIPKSWWGGAEKKQGSDGFIVLPSDGKINGIRSNYPYGITTTGTAWKHTNDTYENRYGTSTNTSYVSGTVFEPFDNRKGDLARTYFYAVAAYYQQSASGSDNLGSPDKWTSGDGSKVFGSGTGYTNCFKDSYLQMLLKWHHDDPVSDWEISTNAKVQDAQGNRNPFVDHPSWVDLIWNNNNNTGFRWPSYAYPSTGQKYENTNNCSATVKNGEISAGTDPIANITGNSSVVIGNNITLTASLQNVTDASKITWSSSATSKATVSRGTTSTTSSVATVTGVAAGSATIYCKYNNVTIGSKEITITSAPVPTISVSASSSSIAVNGTSTLTATTENAGTPTITWSVTSGSSYVTLSSTSGSSITVTGKAAGNATIKASMTVSGTTYSDSENITITSGTSGDYKIIFDTASVDGSTELDVDGLKSLTTTTNNTLVDSFTSVTKCYAGQYGVKLGSSKAAGSFTATPVSDAQTNVSSITIKSTKYSSDTGTLTLSVNGSAVKSNITPGVETTYTPSSPISVESFQIATSSKRAYVGEVSFTVGGSVTPTPEKVLDSISAVYNGGDITIGDSLTKSDIVVTAHYTDSYYSDETLDSSEWTYDGFDSSTTGDKTVTIYYGDESTTVTVTVIDVPTPVPYDENAIFKKIAQISDIDTNTYVIAANNSGTYKAMQNSFSTKINADTINVDSNGIITTSDLSGYIVTITKSGDNVTISTGSTYLTYSSSTNLGTSNSPYNWTISSGTNGTFRIASTNTSNRGVIFRASTYNVFGGYSTTNVTASGTEYYDVELFRLNKAAMYSEEFLASFTCDSTGKNAPTFKTGYSWSVLKTKYSSLPTIDKTTLQEASANENGTTIEQAMARYDYVVHKYAYENYISRTDSGIIIHNALSTDASTATIIIIATSMAAITIIGGALILKRKEQ